MKKVWKMIFKFLYEPCYMTHIEATRLAQNS